MRFLTESEIFSPKQIKSIERKYKAKYVLETCLRSGKGSDWLNWPAAIFYTEKAHPEGSNYFAMYFRPFTDELMIANGLSAIEEPIEALFIDDTVLYSRYRHDFRCFNDVYIDGGRDYTRIGGERLFEAKYVRLLVHNGEIGIAFK